MDYFNLSNRGKITPESAQQLFSDIMSALSSDEKFGLAQRMQEITLEQNLKFKHSNAWFGNIKHKLTEGVYIIYVNTEYFEDKMSHEWLSLASTIAHEIIHAMPNCWNHGIYFKRWMNYLNRTYGFAIGVRGSSEECEVFMESAFSKTKNICVCPDCGKFFLYPRTTQNVRLMRNGLMPLQCACQRTKKVHKALLMVRSEGKDLLNPLTNTRNLEYAKEWVTRHLPPTAVSGEFRWTPERLKQEYWWKKEEPKIAVAAKSILSKPSEKMKVVNSTVEQLSLF